MKRGRKSIASLTTPTINVGRAKVLTVPKGLTKVEADIFTRTAKSFPHITDADRDLLAIYSQAAAKAQRLSKKDDAPSVKAWDIASRCMWLAARSLRLTPQSQAHAQTVARAKANGPRSGNQAPWEDEADSYTRAELGDFDA